MQVNTKYQTYYKLLGTLKNFWGDLTYLGRASCIVLCLLILMALLAPLITWLPADRASGPPLAPPGGEHLLGTDQIGLDLWSMICYGGRVSLTVGVATALLAGLGGALLGMVAGYVGGWVEMLIMRVVDVMIILPDLPVVIVLAAFFGPSLRNIILVLALFSWSRPARIVRSQTLVIKEQPYIRMARLYGGGNIYLIFRHLLPELLPLIIVNMIRLSGRAVMTEASMAFLGLGDPLARSWGLIINHALNFSGIYFTPFWRWWLFYPWLFLTLLVSSLALLGRDLERIADPRVRFGRGR